MATSLDVHADGETASVVTDKRMPDGVANQPRFMRS